MREDLLKFFAAREEPVEMAGSKYTVRTLPDGETVSGADTMLEFVVRCTFDAEGKPAFTDDDIPTLKAAPHVLKAPLLRAVARVNGFDSSVEEKNSEAAPSSG